ncbi:putative non-specific serine/threonine protein kinase [Helianthus debilis subsp. tardiflorus]
MDLSNNIITGAVPSSFGSLMALMSLHLHNNRLEGNLTPSLQNLTSLATLDTGNNSLMGRIPFWIGESLLNLRILNLQSNKFTGKIPLQFCQLHALQHLNLAQNNIVGMIPHCFCNLSGMIINQADSYIEVDFYEENILAYIKGIQLVYTRH